MALKTGFRPLTGILFFNEVTRKENVIMKKYCFRPLTGILFFNSPSEKPCHS